MSISDIVLDIIQNNLQSTPEVLKENIYVQLPEDASIFR